MGQEKLRRAVHRITTRQVRQIGVGPRCSHRVERFQYFVVIFHLEKQAR